MSDLEELEGDALSHHDPGDSDDNSESSCGFHSREVLEDVGEEQEVILAAVNSHEISKLETDIAAGSGISNEKALQRASPQKDAVVDPLSNDDCRRTKLCCKTHETDSGLGLA